MSITQDLYKELILEHARSPSHKTRLPSPTVSEEGVNRSCGDEVEIEISVQDGVIKEICVMSRGCSISTASGSMMADVVEGIQVKQAQELIKKFKAMFTSEGDPKFSEDMEELYSLQGVRKYPIRVKCATLSWSTLGQALKSL